MNTLKRGISGIVAAAMLLVMSAGPAGIAVFADPVNLALGATATASSSGSGQAAANANDADTATYWQADSNDDDMNIVFEFASATAVDKAVISYRDYYITGDITVYVSSDGTDWQKVMIKAAAANGGSDTVNFKKQTVRFVKIGFDGSSNGENNKYMPEITEIGLYESNEAAPEFTDPGEQESQTGGVSVLDPSVATILGKASYEKHNKADTATFTYGASGFTVNFTGTMLEMYVPEVIIDGGSVRDVKVGVLVDTDMPMDATMISINQTGWITLASGLENKKHTVTVRKQSRGFYGIMASDWFCVSEIRTDGAFSAPNPRSDLVIEVFGDSITNGDAVWYNADRSNSAWTYGSYSSVVGRLLGAESKICGNTGNGLLGWVMAEKNGKLDNLLPPQDTWNKIDPNHGGKPYSHDGENQADVAIVNLGTNDRGELSNGDMTHTMFEDEYIRFAKQMRTDCPNIIVIATVGAMGDMSAYGVDFDRICNECNAWAGETYCYFLPLQKCDTIGQNEKVQSYKDGRQTNIPAGAGYDNGHPSNLAHEIYGLQLATLINEVLGLGVDLPDDIPAESFKARTGKDAPDRNLIEYLTGRTDTISKVYDVIRKYSGDPADPTDPTDPVVVSENLALTGTIIVDSVNAQFGGAGANANDGDRSTRWQSNAKGNNGDEGWIGVRLDKVYKLGSLVIEWETAHPSKDGFRVEISDDGETWVGTPFTSVRTGEESDDHQVDTVTLTGEPETEYVRVVCFEAYENADGQAKENPSVYEFEVYAAANAEVSRTAAQISTNAGANKIRLLAAVNAGEFESGVSDKYVSVGFEITVTDASNGSSVKKTFTGNAVYESVNGVTADDMGVADGKMFCLIVNNVPENCTMNVTAVAFKADGTAVYGNGGEAAEFVVSNGAITAGN